MNFKKIITETPSNSKKGKNKIINTDEITYDRISLIADLFQVSKSQVIHNIMKCFILENEEEIKELHSLKVKKVEDIF